MAKNKSKGKSKNTVENAVALKEKVAEVVTDEVVEIVEVPAPVVETPTAETPTAETKTTKALKPKAEPKAKSEPKAKENTDVWSLMFPEKIEGDVVLTPCKGEFKNFEEIRAAFDAGRKLYFICSWTEASLKEHDYCGSYSVPKKFMKENFAKGFPNNADVAQLIWITSYGDGYAISNLTEAMYRFLDEDLPYNKKGVRMCVGMPFEIYEEVPQQA